MNKADFITFITHFIMLHPPSDIYGFSCTVYKEYSLRVIESASLPACVLKPWMSSLPQACIDAHGCPRLRCPRFTSHPLCFEWYFNVAAKKMWPGSGKWASSVLCGVFWHYFRHTDKDETTLASCEGAFIQSLFAVVWSNSGIFILFIWAGENDGIWNLCPIYLYGRGGIYGMYCSEPPGGDWNVLASLLVIVHLFIQSLVLIMYYIHGANVLEARS